jgi:hypothetical protein
MYYISKKISLSLLAATAVICGVVLYIVFGDLGVFNVVLLTILLYIFSIATYIFNPDLRFQDIGKQIDATGISLLEHLSLNTLTGIKRLLLTIFIQIIITLIIFVLLS